GLLQVGIGLGKHPHSLRHDLADRIQTPAVLIHPNFRPCLGFENEINRSFDIHRGIITRVVYHDRCRQPRLIGGRSALPLFRSIMKRPFTSILALLILTCPLAAQAPALPTGIYRTMPKESAPGATGSAIPIENIEIISASNANNMFFAGVRYRELPC